MIINYKNLNLVTVLLITGCLIGLLSVVWFTKAAGNTPLTEMEIIRLHNENISDTAIISHAQSCGLAFSLTTDAIINLRRSGISNHVIEELIQIADTQTVDEEIDASASPIEENEGYFSSQKSPFENDGPVESNQKTSSSPNCTYLKKLEEINNRYEKTSRLTLSTLTSSLNTSSIDEILENKKRQKNEISFLNAPTELRELHRQILDYMDKEMELFHYVKQIMKGDVGAAATAKNKAYSILNEGKSIYSRHNSFRRKCGMPPLPDLSMFNF